MVAITGLVNTRNAGATLDLCLASLQPHVDEILVVDMESDDNTVAVARQFGARVLDHPPVGYVEPARAVGIAAAEHDWILVLDADEVLPPTLGRRLRQIAEEDEADYVVIGWRNYLFGGVTEYGPFAPSIDRHARFFRRQAMTHPADVHAPPQPSPESRRLMLDPVPDLCVSHFAYADVSEWLARSDRYTSIEAEDSRAAGRPPPSTVAVLGGAIASFARSYVRQRGYRDGWRGLHTCLLLAHYRLVLGLKTQQVMRVGRPDEIRARYRQIASEIISDA
jgi:glycosyltransferase involved in cell wall biosynthesis